MATVKDPEQDATMISRLVEFKAFVDNVVTTSFSSGSAGSDYEFGNAVKDAFSNALSQRRNRPAEMLGALSFDEITVKVRP